MRDISPGGGKMKPMSDKDKMLWNVPKEVSGTAKKMEPKKRITGANVPVAKIEAEKPFARTGLPDEEILELKEEVKKKKPKRKRLWAGKPNKSKTGQGGSVKPKPVKAKMGGKDKLWIVGFSGIVIIAAILAGILFIPKADVELAVKTSPLNFEDNVRVASESGSSDVAATVFFSESEVIGEIESSGREFAGEPATGRVRIVNRSIEEQTIKERSRLVTDDGVLFYLVEAVRLPAASDAALAAVSAEIVADQPGPTGNIEPQRLNFVALDESAQSLIYAELDQAIESGEGEEISVVTADDIEDATKEAARQGWEMVRLEFENRLPPGWALVFAAEEADLSQVEILADEGDASEVVKFIGKVGVRAIGYNEVELLEKLALAVAQELNSSMTLFPGDPDLEIGIKEVDWQQGTAELGVRVDHLSMPRLSVNEIRDTIKGRELKQAQEYLEGLNGVERVTVSSWPWNIGWLPRIASRIHIDINSAR